MVPAGLCLPLPCSNSGAVLTHQWSGSERKSGSKLALWREKYWGMQWGECWTYESKRRKGRTNCWNAWSYMIQMLLPDITLISEHQKAKSCIWVLAHRSLFSLTNVEEELETYCFTFTMVLQCLEHFPNHEIMVGYVESPSVRFSVITFLFYFGLISHLKDKCETWNIYFSAF